MLQLFAGPMRFCICLIQGAAFIQEQKSDNRFCALFALYCPHLVGHYECQNTPTCFCPKAIVILIILVIVAAFAFTLSAALQKLQLESRHLTRSMGNSIRVVNLM